MITTTLVTTPRFGMLFDEKRHTYLSLKIKGVFYLHTPEISAIYIKGKELQDIQPQYLSHVELIAMLKVKQTNSPTSF